MVDQETLTLDMLSEDCIALSDKLPRSASELGYPAMGWQLKQIARRYRRLLTALYKEGRSQVIPPDDEKDDVLLEGVGIYTANAGRFIRPHYTGWIHQMDDTGLHTICGKRILPYDYRVVDEAAPHQLCPMCYLLTIKFDETSPTNPTN